MKRALICANWKMSKGIKEAHEFASTIKEQLSTLKGVEVVLFPPFTAIFEVSKILSDSRIGVGAQNVHYKESGAFTGEVSAPMLKEVGCKYVIIGHSERRKYAKEDDALIKMKVEAALSHALNVILCVGEDLREREEGREREVVERQLSAIEGVKFGNLEKLIIAYEPVWAIGTGRTATVDVADSMHSFIKEQIRHRFREDAQMRIIYGGSVFPENIGALMEAPNIDGALVGGASLDVSSFLKIVEVAEKVWMSKDF